MKSNVMARPRIEIIVVGRALLGLNLVEFSERAGVHFTTLSGIETGRFRSVTPKIAYKIAYALGKPVEEVFEMEYKNGVK